MTGVIPFDNYKLNNGNTIPSFGLGCMDVEK